MGRLVITRKQGEQIVVLHQGERLVIDVASLERSQVRLALLAPPTFQFFRGELAPHEEDAEHELVALYRDEPPEGSGA